MGTADRKKAEKESRKELILEASVRLMQAHGVHHLNIDAVAKETSLAKGTIYLYFKSKEEIIATLSTRARLMILEDFRRIDAGPGTCKQKILSIVEASYQFYVNSGVYYDLVSLYEGDHALTETTDIYEVSHQITELVTNLVKGAVAEKSLPKSTDPLLFTLTLWPMTFGMLRFIKGRSHLMTQKLGFGPEKLYNHYMQMVAQLFKK